MKKIDYSLGDKFLLGGIEYSVAYINHGEAWLSPLHEGDVLPNHRSTLVGLVEEQLDVFGYNTKGIKARAIVNNGCAAV